MITIEDLGIHIPACYRTEIKTWLKELPEDIEVVSAKDPAPGTAGSGWAGRKDLVIRYRGKILRGFIGYTNHSVPYEREIRLFVAAEVCSLREKYFIYRDSMVPHENVGPHFIDFAMGIWSPY